jgi:hypothetical protein
MRCLLLIGVTINSKACGYSLDSTQAYYLFQMLQTLVSVNQIQQVYCKNRSRHWCPKRRNVCIGRQQSWVSTAQRNTCRVPTCVHRSMVYTQHCWQRLKLWQWVHRTVEVMHVQRKAAHLVATHFVSFLPSTGQPPWSACLSKVPLTCRL